MSVSMTAWVCHDAAWPRTGLVARQSQSLSELEYPVSNGMARQGSQVAVVGGRGGGRLPLGLGRTKEEVSVRRWDYSSPSSGLGAFSAPPQTFHLSMLCQQQWCLRCLCGDKTDSLG